jgi:4-amino-4-deoxy-L-arabinose transferase-like glycosyltransferase
MNELAESIDRSSAPSTNRGRMVSNSRQRWMLLVIFAGMASLQIGLAPRQCLWVDEIFSLAIATGHSLEQPAALADPARGDFVESDHPVRAEQLRRYLSHEYPPAGLARVLRAVLLSDTSPPLYYLLLYFWTLILGTSDIALRLFSILWALACFPLVPGIARRTGGRRAVLPACVLFALSPMGLYFSGEGRMYSLLLFCIVATASVSLALYAEGGGATRYVLWIVASAAGFLTHYFFIFSWAAIVSFLLIFPGRLERRNLIGSVVVLALAISPWYLVARGSLGHWRITQGWLNLRPSGFHRSRTIRNQFLQFFSAGGAGPWRSERWSSYGATALFALGAAAAAWRLRLRAFAGPRLLVWLWFIVSCSAPIVIDLLQHTYVSNNPRYVITALPAAYFLAAIAFGALDRRICISLLLLIAFTWAVPIMAIYHEQYRTGDPFETMAQTVSSNSNLSDLTLVHSIPSGVLGIARYADGASNIASWVQQLGTRRVPDSLLTLAAGRSRIRFVKVHQLAEPAPEEDWLRTNAVLSREIPFQFGLVADFRPMNSDKF